MRGSEWRGGTSMATPSETVYQNFGRSVYRLSAFVPEGLLPANASPATALYWSGTVAMQASAPLARFPILDSRDPEEVATRLSEVLGSHRLIVRDRTVQFHAVANATTVASSSVAYLECDVPVTCHAEVEHSYLFFVLLEGRARLRMERSEFDLTPEHGAVIAPDRRFSLDTLGRAAALLWKVSRSALERQAALLTEQLLSDAIRFEPHVRLDLGKGPSLLRALRFVASELQDDSGVAHSRAVQENLEQMLIRALLDTQPSQITQALESRESQVVPRCVLRVERYIDEHLAGEITVEGMIEASGVSARTMFSAFKKYRGKSPMSHVRHLRLQQVRRDLMDAEPGTRVTDILTKRGITQFGRFAVIYKKIYGESPSQTIKR